MFLSLLEAAVPAITRTQIDRLLDRLLEFGISAGKHILIAAIGKPGYVTADMVKPGAVVIDVGTTRVPDPSRPSGYRLSGDVDFEHVAPLCSYISPVPGGVGPMTICMLMRNTLAAAKHEYY